MPEWDPKRIVVLIEMLLEILDAVRRAEVCLREVDLPEVHLPEVRLLEVRLLEVRLPEVRLV